MGVSQGIGLSLCAMVMSVYASAQSNRVTMTTDQQYRYITSNGIPNHRIGKFPNANNPNSIQVQNHSFKVPLKPVQASRVTPLQLFPFGVATNGIPFDPGAMEFWNRDRTSGWQFEALSGRINLGLDANRAHVQPGGAYHYHGLPPFAMPTGNTINQMVLAGYAADGFSIYVAYGYSDPKDMRSPLKIMRSSYRLKKGIRPSGPGGRYDGTFVQDYEFVSGAGDLDECNGRFGVTPSHPEGIYHYFLTEAYPFIPRFFRGTPDISFQRRGPGPGGPGGDRRRPPPGGFGGRRPPPPPPR